MNEESGIDCIGDELGRFRNIKKKAVMCTKYPSNTIGSRPCLLVFLPSRPNSKPPKISKYTLLLLFIKEPNKIQY